MQSVSTELRCAEGPHSWGPGYVNRQIDMLVQNSDRIGVV